MPIPVAGLVLGFHFRKTCHTQGPSLKLPICFLAMDGKGWLVPTI